MSNGKINDQFGKDTNCVRIMLTNARSLMPKIKSLKDAFQYMQHHIVGVTETWFKGRRSWDRNWKKLKIKMGLKSIKEAGMGWSKE